MRSIIVFIFALCASALAHADGVSPGPLARDHASVEGVENCIKCHSGGDTVSAPACLACHKVLGARIAARAGFHATTGSDCASCHPDHRGVGAPLVKWPGGKREAFDHGKAGYKLDGGHAKVECAKCHKTRSFIGLGTTCAGCHADVHKPTLGTDCQRCHDLKDPKGWRGAATSTGFDHAKTKFPLAGGHAKVECTKCHGGTTQKLGDLHPKSDTCRTCHPDPHATAMGPPTMVCQTCHQETAWKAIRFDRKTHPKTLPLVNAHAKPTCAGCHGAKIDKKPIAACSPCHAEVHKPSLGARCETCHTTVSWTKAAPKAEFHDKTAYPLRGLHATVACDKCHDPKKPAAKRYRPTVHGKCLDCHADVHHGEASKPCESCHGVDGWKPPRFELADHAKTKFPLDGAHRAVPCAKCHAAPPNAPGFARGNPACETCHADPHAGQFKDKGTCATCHGVVAWAPSTFAKDAHAKAGFALAGKHDVACARCHVKKFVGVSPECSTCHADTHAGQFAPRACTTCHAGAEWKPTPGFDHAKTFVLRDRHAAAACAKCHPSAKVALTPSTSVATVVYKLGAPSHDCAGCHRAQHGDPKSGLDQPRRLAAATRACGTCHRETAWREVAAAPAFDHGTTGAPLVGGHARAPCSSCHQTGRALPKLVACAACHADRHAGRLGDRCEACHSPSTWKQDRLLVDHQRTRLPLVGAHAVQGCPSCHKDAQAGVFRGLDPACRGCHVHTVEERRPHPDHLKDNAFNQCENCHSVLGWRPAHFNHDSFWPLTGAHTTTPCTSCHKPGEMFGAAPTTCNGCHARPGAGSATDHSTFSSACGDTLQCQNCHTTSGWSPAKFPCHAQFFPSGHGGSCAGCHTTPGMPSMYSCTQCHHHSNAGNIDNAHDGVGGYRNGEQDCARAGCHAMGAHLGGGG